MELAKKVEIFARGPLETDRFISLIRKISLPMCEVTLCDLSEDTGTTECRDKASRYGIKAFPAIMVDGRPYEGSVH